MITRHYRQHPIVGDSTLKAPAKLKFSKMKHTDFIQWLRILTESGAFKEDIHDFYVSTVRTFMAGYIARDGDKIVGCVGLSMQNGFPTIKYLYVSPSYRRKKVGWFLANMCLLRAKANTYNQVHAYIDVDNVPALELFKKLGFEEVM